MSRARLFAAALGVLALVTACAGAPGSDPGGIPDPIRFAVGPFLPTAADTQEAYEPFFAALAGELGVDYELQVTQDWAAIAVALGSGQVDLAWMGPFGYVIAETRSGAEAIATVEYDGEPTYHAIVVAGPDSDVENWPEDAEGMSMSFAEVASTSGWLVPTFFLTEQGIDPETYFDYSEGAAHPANELAVATGQVDLATDYDRNRNAMISAGALEETATKVVWESEPLPNDAIAVRGDLDPALAEQIQSFLVAISDEQAAEFMPDRYTGFVASDADTYQMIEDAAVELDALDG